MASEDLRQRLASLHQLLTRHPELDAESRDLLRTVLTDIESVLEEGVESPTIAAPDSAPRIEGLAVRFEADHPALAGALRQLTDLLAKAGI